MQFRVFQKEILREYYSNENFNPEAIRDFFCNEFEESRDVKIRVNVIFVGLEEIARINKDFRGKQEATDVISFNLTPELGEIYISPEFIKNSEYGSSIQEVYRMIVHGVLHILGHEHDGKYCGDKEVENEEKMFQIQESALKYIMENSLNINIVGLGNVGDEYFDTPHNAGFIFCERLANRFGVSFSTQKALDCSVAKVNLEDGRRLSIVKPTTMMNLSGQAARHFAKVGKLVLAYDDLDVDLGKYKYTQGKTPKVHNGVNDVINHVGKGFESLKLGVHDNDSKLREFGSGQKYLLTRMTQDQLILLYEAVDEAIEEFLSRFEIL